MVGAKPNAYLTEEARLEAQRRMLAERYGLFSDESDEGEPTSRQTSSSAAPPNGSAAQNGDTHAPTATANGSDGPLPSPHHEPASSEAATYGENSSVRDSDLTFVMSQDESFQDSVSASATNEPDNSTSSTADRATRWPGVEILDPHHSNMICASYQYKNENVREAVSSRDLRVTQITMYPSQFLERHERKIAVNDRVITYAVGGHIRAILRNSPESRCLLKGHDSSVADLEFLAAQETDLSVSMEGEYVSILGSVADDGSVFVWKIIRKDTANTSHLELQDNIRFEHPQHEKGRSYRRIAFRPGPNSIIAENGIGVAMLLMDGDSPDLRVVELVKMNGRMMVRDKFLKARNETVEKGGKIDGNIDAAAWLSEKIVVTSRGGHVHLWNSENNLSPYIVRLPRDKPTRVTSIHAFKHNGLLVVVDAGRELEYWHIAEMPQNMRSISVQLRQRIQLFSNQSDDVFCITAVDPAEEIVIVSNVKGKSFFVLHHNRTAKAFDSITEVPVRQSVLSCSMTRNDRPPIPNSMSSFSELNPSPSDDLGVWCVQPRGINLIHLPFRDCAPRTSMQSEVYPVPAMKTISRKIEKIPQPIAQQAAPSNVPSGINKPRSGQSSTSPATPIAKRLPRSLNNVKNLSASQSTTKQSRDIVTSAGKLSGQRGGITIAPSTIAAAAIRSNPAAASGSSTSSQPSGSSTTNKDSASQKASSSAAPVAVASPSSDELADALLSAAKKAIAAFEESAPQRSANEKVKMERLIESVSETEEINLERYINSSMKRILAEKLVPGVSQVIAESKEAMKHRARKESKITSDDFKNVLERSGINATFSSACDEMTRQVSHTLSKAMTSKYECTIKPAIEVVNDAAQDISATVSVLGKEMQKVEGSKSGTGDIVEIKPEDTRCLIEKHVTLGNIDEAFLTALDKEDLSMVTWLCGKFDCSTFFESYTLSQVSLLSLAQQLGHLLRDDDVELKVEWLREIMLVLEPECVDIESVAMGAIEDLTGKVKDIRNDKEFLDQYDGLEKKLKTLGRLIASHMSN